jgi:CO/xanthine dehydrogenase Mo-binding subunit/aerobic-type carbon monoxide dehydrogenase small subunit (CoxS/CutS family)
MNRPRADLLPQMVELTVNGRRVRAASPRGARLADVLRDELGLTGTKIGCNAGDCGACTVLLDGRQVCSCLTALGQVEGRRVTTVEGLARRGKLSALQASFQRHGAAQCGACTPGMLMAAESLLRGNPRPSEAEVKDALGGVLCRCTGYRRIVDAVLDAGRKARLPDPPAAGRAVGARAGRVDGPAKLDGREKYGADAIPADALWLRVIRSPHHHALFRFGDLEAFRAKLGLTRILTAADVPSNGFGIYPHIKDQPVLADGRARFRGEAIAAIVGPRAAVERIASEDFPVTYEPRDAVLGLDAAMAQGAALVQEGKPRNLLLDGTVRKGDARGAFERCAHVAAAEFETAFVEHAYIEPEAGWARRIGDRIEVHVTTQTPYMDRDEVALILKLRPDQVRIVPTACGGGFGGKLDLSVQPLVALAAWLIGQPVACVYTRPESMASTTKRHPARIRARLGCDRGGKLVAAEVDAVFDTGAYASWGPTVATRVPIHATGPYAVPNVLARGRAYFTHCHPSGAFRGFGVPQGAIAHEALMDELADRAGIDRLEFRRRNALRAGDRTATGQKLAASAGLVACLDSLKGFWKKERLNVKAFNAKNRKRGSPLRRGVGIGCMWYGIGNTALSNPSTMRVALTRDGKVVLRSGAAEIGQGVSTILTQICADALGLPMDAIGLVAGDTDLTADAGKSSASRQTFVSGKAAELAALDLRQKMRAAGITKFRKGLKLDRELVGEGYFDPPTSPADADGQGTPYATYAFAAQVALVEVDTALGTTRVLRILAAHDVGRAINPTQVEGQIEGGIAQGLGLALMEEYLPGRTENLHDYLIPTVGDVPRVRSILVEDPEPLGPSGAKGVGEPGLIPTAPAILGAIEHATGVRVRKLPVLPHRLRAELRNARS